MKERVLGAESIHVFWGKPCAVLAHFVGMGLVLEIAHEDVLDFFKALAVQNLEHDFKSFVQVPAQPVGA